MGGGLRIRDSEHSWISSPPYGAKPSRDNIGEMVAVMVVVIAILLLGWEMLNLFHIFPIRINH